MREVALATALFAAALGVFASVALVKGTASVPWEMQTWNGESGAENAFRQSVRWWLKTGFVALGSAFVFSAISAIAAYLAV